MPLALDQLTSIISSGDFEKLVGEIENQFFDVKGQLYQFDSGDHAKRELAKDVTAFANAGGGYIILCAGTTQRTTHPGEEVAELRPFERHLLDIQRYHDLIAEWTHPLPIRVGIEWFPLQQSAKGIGVITVPPQSERSKPFLITKTIIGAKSSETLLGYAERTRDSTQALSVVELQHALRIGLNFEREIGSRLDAVESTLTSFIERSALQESVTKREDELKVRVEFALQHDNLSKQRILILAACPTEPNQLTTLFSTEQGSIRSQLARPPASRPNGWDLSTNEQAETIAGKLVRAGGSTRKVLDLYRDGCLIFVASAGADFLAWATNDDRKLNPLALAEVVLNFTNFYKLVIQDMRNPPAQLMFRIELRNTHLQAKRTLLPPYHVTSAGFRFSMGAKESPLDSWGTDLIVEADRFDPERVAYELLHEIYIWFGHDEDAIPYTTVIDGVRKMDSKKIDAA